MPKTSSGAPRSVVHATFRIAAREHGTNLLLDALGNSLCR